MAAALTIMTVSALVLLAICIVQRKEINSIARQLKQLKSIETNALVRSSSGTADRLINEINALLIEIRQSQVDYNRRNHELEQMMTNISHDLRTPLTSAMGYIGMVRTSDIPEQEKQRELEIIERRLVRLEELINSFFEFSKMISRGEPPELEELDPTAVLEEAAVHYFDDYCARNRSISLDTPHKRIKYRSSRSMLMRIFDNLIGNALKHGKGDLHITLTEGERLTFIFENSTDEHIDTERIFEEFYTTDISRTKGNSGLGLAIAKQFTELLGGSISAEFEDEVFRIILVL